MYFFLFAAVTCCYVFAIVFLIIIVKLCLFLSRRYSRALPLAIQSNAEVNTKKDSNVARFVLLHGTPEFSALFLNELSYL